MSLTAPTAAARPRAPDGAPATLAGARWRIGDFPELMKLRLNLLVLGAVATGYVLAAPAPFALWNLLGVLAGVLLAGGGSSALNMAIEAPRDRLMERTRNRPVAAGRITREEAAAFGVACAVLGAGLTALAGGALAGALCAATVLLYVLVYTPLKPLTTANTLVGAVPGAIPPLIGWAAATGSLAPAAMTLFGVVFFWQFPHFYAIASVHREDYARGGFAMLPVVDRSGLRTAHHVLVAAFAMIPAALLPAVYRLAGPAYCAAALALAAVYLVFSLRACLRASRGAWRDLLRASLVVLPGLFVLMLIDRLPLD